jgi:hypothetical protein
VHAGEGVEHFTDYKGVAVEVELHLRSPKALGDQIRHAGFVVEAAETRPPYPFEHPTPRLYVTAVAH